MHRGRHPQNRVARHFADFGHMGLGVFNAIHRTAFEHDVAHHAVHPRLHLGGEPGHHAVHDDHRRDAKHHAHDANQRDVTRAKITPAEQEFVHRVPFRGTAVSDQLSATSVRPRS